MSPDEEQLETVLISGGGGRLGSAFVRALIASGHSVCILDSLPCAVTIKRCGLDDTDPSDFKVIQGDATDPADIDHAIESCVALYGRVTAAVHCAYPRSDQWGTRFEDLGSEKLYQDLAAQLGGAILFSQRVIRQFRSQGFGNLIHISSILGVAPPKFRHYEGVDMVSPIEYSAIKAGIIAVTRYLAKYCHNQGIRVNCICPGGILDDQPPEFLERYRKDCNSKGMLDSEDIVGTLLFLMSSRSSFITGQSFVIDDGWSL